MKQTNKYYELLTDSEQKINLESEHICQGFKQCDISKFDKNGGHCQECFDDVQQAIEDSMKEIYYR